jgi:hypothetical protein
MRQTTVRAGVLAAAFAGLVTAGWSCSAGVANDATPDSSAAMKGQPATVPAPTAQTSTASAPGGAVRTVLCSLEPDETIVENDPVAVVLSADTQDLALVTVKGSGGSATYFARRNGTRRGPFGTLADAAKAAYDGGQPQARRARDCATYEPAPAPATARLSVARTSGGEAYRFNDSSFGPHRIVFSQRITPDGAVAYITAADNDKAWLEASDGRKVSFGGIPGEFKVSPDGRSAAVLVEGRFSMDEMDTLAKSPEKFAAVAGEMNKKRIYTIDGKSFGPFDAVSYWYAKTSNDLFYRVGEQVFRNGAPMLEAGSFDPCGFYPTPDGRSYAMFTYSSITFSDGTTYPSALDVFAYQDKGKTVFRWLALENKKDLVAYRRPM